MSLALHFRRLRDRLWHAPLPVHRLGLYRLGFGIVAAAEAASWLPDAAELFSSAGFHSPPLGAFAPPAPPPAVAPALCGALVLAAAAFAAGLFTRAANAATLLLWGYLYLLDGINEKAAWSLTLVILAVLLFSPCGAAWSIDAWRRRSGGSGTQRQQRQQHSIVPWRLLQLQFAQVYFFSGLIKLGYPDWWQGRMIGRVLHSRWATELGVWLSGALPAWAASVLAWGTIAYELAAAPLLLWPRTRRVAIVAGVLFHLGIQATLAVGSLGPHFVLALLLLFPPGSAQASPAEGASGSQDRGCTPGLRPG